MIEDQYLDFDLDYLIDFDNPIGELHSIIRELNPKTPTEIVVSHQSALSPMMWAAKKGFVETPMHIIHVDRHHDMYNGAPFQTPGRSLSLADADCSNFVFAIPLKSYDRFTWVRDHLSKTDSGEWMNGKRWLHMNGKKVVDTEMRAWNPRMVGAACFCLSPDYMDDCIDLLIPMCLIIAHHFGIDRIPFGTSRNPRQWENLGDLLIDKRISSAREKTMETCYD